MKFKFKYTFEPKPGMLIEFFGRHLIWAFALIGFFHYAQSSGLDINWRLQLGVICSAVWVLLPFLLSWRKRKK